MNMNIMKIMIFLDGNNVTPAGYQQFRGCFYGNQKLIDVPFPQKDVDNFFKNAEANISKYLR